jgi:hypothetical protein
MKSIKVTKDRLYAEERKSAMNHRKDSTAEKHKGTERCQSKLGNRLQLQPQLPQGEGKPKPPAQGKLDGLGDRLADLTVGQKPMPPTSLKPSAGFGGKVTHPV